MVHTRRHLLIQAAAAAALLAGCKDGAGPAAGTKPETVPVSIDAIASEARGFNVGSTMSTRTVYVFFDPQCPHCATLWQTARPLRPQARFVWVPVSVLNDKSGPQGAALLGAPDPVAAMDQHEASITARTGGIAAMNATDENKAAVKKNTELMNRFGFASVPTVVAKHAQTGETVTIEGSAPTATLAQRLGLQIPGG